MKWAMFSLVLAAGVGLIGAGCGTASGGSATGTPEIGSKSGMLDPHDVRPVLRALPFSPSVERIEGPDGNVASFRGRAHGPHKTTVEFSIGIGDPPKAIPVRGLGFRNVAWESASGFAYNDNAWPTQFSTSAQWKQAAKISVAIWESLCKAATGEPCPI